MRQDASVRHDPTGCNVSRLAGRSRGIHYCFKFFTAGRRTNPVARLPKLVQRRRKATAYMAAARVMQRYDM